METAHKPEHYIKPASSFPLLVFPLILFPSPKAMYWGAFYPHPQLSIYSLFTFSLSPQMPPTTTSLWLSFSISTHLHSITPFLHLLLPPFPSKSLSCSSLLPPFLFLILLLIILSLMFLVLSLSLSFPSFSCFCFF